VFADPRLPPGLAHRFWPPAGWAWGAIEIKGKPALRYGVAAPQGEARADVVILTGHGESAELWFETTRTLVDDGYAVWILEGAGEGGSANYAGHDDVAHVPDFEADIRGLVALHRKVVRPKRRVAVIASGTAAFPALAAVQRGYRPAALILSGPFEPGPNKAWKRPDPADALSLRRRALGAWAVANPDLRMGGVTSSWSKAQAALRDQTLSALALGRVATKVTVITKGAQDLPCGRIPACREAVISSPEAYLFSGDMVQKQWLGEIFESLPR